MQVGVAAACGLSSLVNPYGLDLLKTWHVIMGEPALKAIIQEHSALDPTASYAWPVFGFAALYVVVLAGVPRREWRQMFDEAWRLERDYFYDTNMHGVDWKANDFAAAQFARRIGETADYGLRHSRG